MKQGDTIVGVNGVPLAKEVSSGKLGEKEDAVSAMIRGKKPTTLTRSSVWGSLGCVLGWAGSKGILGIGFGRKALGIPGM